MDNEKRSVKITRKELESIVFKSGGRSYGTSLGIPLLYTAAGLCVLLLIMMALPQATVDSWIQRLQAGQQAVTQSSLINPEKLELLKLEDEWANSLFSVSGVVRNRTNEPIRGAEAVVKLYSKKGLITTIFVDLDASDLAPNQRAGFRASYRLTVDAEPLTTYELSFKLKDGTPLLHQDLRGVASDR